MSPPSFPSFVLVKEKAVSLPAKALSSSDAGASFTPVFLATLFYLLSSLSDAFNILLSIVTLQQLKVIKSISYFKISIKPFS